MSEKNWLVVNIVDGKLCQIKERNTYSEAFDVALTLAQEQCDVLEIQIRKEFEEDGNFMSPNEDILVYLTQANDDLLRESQ
jgi:hypothetical protein